MIVEVKGQNCNNVVIRYNLRLERFPTAEIPMFIVMLIAEIIAHVKANHPPVIIPFAGRFGVTIGDDI